MRRYFLSFTKKKGKTSLGWVWLLEKLLLNIFYGVLVLLDIFRKMFGQTYLIIAELSQFSH